MPERGRNGVALVRRADHDKALRPRAESEPERKSDHSSIRCAYHCVQRANADLIECRGEGFSLVDGRDRGGPISASDIIYADDWKLSSVDCAPWAGHFFPPSARRIWDGRCDVPRCGDAAEYGDDRRSSRSDDLKAHFRRIVEQWCSVNHELLLGSHGESG